MSAGRAILIIANPTSGKGRGRRTAETVAGLLQSRGHDVDIHYTEAQGHAERIADDALPTHDCVVACGGDGTIHEVANALARRAAARSGDPMPTFGLAPTGRCNDFARAMGISKRPEHIADTLANGVPIPVDLGCVNGRYFCTVATIGIDAEVTSFVDSMRMPLSGTVAYLYGAVRVLMTYQPRTLRITGDFGVIEQPVFVASSANTSSYGGAIPIAPDAVPTDGMLDLCVIRHVSRLRALRLIPTVLAGKHGSLAETRIVRSSRLNIDADETVELWADGERVGNTPATIETKPGAIRLMLPADRSTS